MTISVEKRERIESLARQGATVGDIVRKVGCSRPTAAKYAGVAPPGRLTPAVVVRAPLEHDPAWAELPGPDFVTRFMALYWKGATRGYAALVGVNLSPKESK